MRKTGNKMKIKFTKMEGCGNDYIYINCFNQKIKSPDSLAVCLSNRHFGIGGDGIVLILPSAKADVKMRMFNADGSEGKMCGNAIRCVARYLWEEGITRKESLTVETLSGVKELFINIENGSLVSVKVNMGRAELEPAKIPVNLPGESVLAAPVEIGGKTYEITCVSMGNPHAIVFCGDIASLKLEEIGPLFENNPLFPERINTEFVQVLAGNKLKMRVWERGSGETLACGTGACAAAVAAVLNGFSEQSRGIEVEVTGGKLLINYTPETVFMTGPCRRVFEGEVEVQD
jgi:carbamoyl-phosphate synthase large subunit